MIENTAWVFVGDGWKVHIAVLEPTYKEMDRSMKHCGIVLCGKSGALTPANGIGPNKEYLCRKCERILLSSKGK